MLVRELVDTVKLLSDLISGTRDIVEAINDGRRYLAERFPTAEPDFAELISQMQRTLEGLAEVTKVVSAFRFDIETTGSDLARFNDYVLEQGVTVVRLGGSIRDLKGSCEKVRRVRDSLDAKAGHGWGSLFGLLGQKAEDRRSELISPVSNFYADDQRIIEMIESLLKMSQAALDEVDAELGPPGVAHAYNIPAAAATLRVYAAVFKESDRELLALIDTLDEARRALTTN